MIIPEKEDELTISKEDIIKELENLIIDSIKSRYPDDKCGLLFSGGVDSTTIAYILKFKLNKEFTCYTSGVDDDTLEPAKDVIESSKISKEYKLNQNTILANLDEIEQLIPQIIKIINSSNVIKVGVALPFYLCIKKASEDGIKVIYSGLGSEEIFAGYDRHKKAQDINEECRKGLNEMNERDLIRDNAIADHFGIKLAFPFLDNNLIRYALRIPGEFKINGEENKLILRETSINIGLKEEYARRKKMGAQYGSKFDRAIQKIAKKNGFKFKSEYLNSLNPNKK